MIGRLVIIWTSAIVSLAGCQSHKISIPAPETSQSPSTRSASGLCTAVADFLRNRNLPELESVEVWQNDYGPGLRLLTAHYEVLTTLMDPVMLGRIPEFVESTYRAYNHQLPEPVETPSTPSIPFRRGSAGVPSANEGPSPSTPSIPLRRGSAGVPSANEGPSPSTRSGAVPSMRASGGPKADGSRAPARNLHARFVIYLFADRAQWENFTRTFAGEQAEIFCRIQAGAYYHRNACVAYDIGPDRTFSVLGHEGWHQFNDRHFKFRLPSWLDEGVAMLFEAQSCKDGSFDFRPENNAYRLKALRKTLEADAMIPLEQLIATTPGDVLATDQTEAVMAFYSQSYALARFLSSGTRLAAYRRLLADGLHGDWPLDEVSRKIAADRSVPRNVLWNHIVGLVLFQEYVGDDFATVEQEYLAFCREITSQWQKNPRHASF